MSGQSSDPIFRLPRSRSSSILVGLAGLAIFSAGGSFEYFLLRHETETFKDRSGMERTTTRAERWPNAALFAVLMALGPVMAIGYARTSPLEIREDGIKLDRRDRKVFPWDQIESCHWGQFQPGTLNVHSPDGLAFVSVPEPHRAAVEAAIRRFGKWRD